MAYASFKSCVYLSARGWIFHFPKWQTTALTPIINVTFLVMIMLFESPHPCLIWLELSKGHKANHVKQSTLKIPIMTVIRCFKVLVVGVGIKTLCDRSGRQWQCIKSAQTSHLKGFSPECCKEWTFRDMLRLKDFPHVSQVNGMSFVWAEDTNA